MLHREQISLPRWLCQIKLNKKIMTVIVYFVLETPELTSSLRVFVPEVFTADELKRAVDSGFWQRTLLI